jgi:hypothetical protein
MACSWGGDSMKYAVAFGNAFDGHNFYGPFDSSDEAIDYGSDREDGDWFVIPLEVPHA